MEKTTQFFSFEIINFFSYNSDVISKDHFLNIIYFQNLERKNDLKIFVYICNIARLFNYFNRIL